MLSLFTRSAVKTVVPRSDVYKSAKEFLLELEIPGVRKEDVIMESISEKLVIKAKKSVSTFEEFEKIHSKRNFTPFECEIDLPNDVDSERIEGSCINGVLTVRIPRKTQKSVEIKVQ